MEISGRINKIDRVQSNPVNPVNPVKRFDSIQENYLYRYQNAFIISDTSKKKETDWSFKPKNKQEICY